MIIGVLGERQTTRHIQWIVKMLQKNEPYNEVSDIIKWFEKNKQRVDVADRDVGRFPSLASAREAMGRYSDKSARSIDNDARARARNEIDVVVRQGGITVIHPKTELASVYYGKGTKWCVSATKSKNYFDDYLRDGIKLYFFHAANKGPVLALSIDEIGDMHWFDEEDNGIKGVNASRLVGGVKRLKEMLLSIFDHFKQANAASLDNGNSTWVESGFNKEYAALNDFNDEEGRANIEGLMKRIMDRLSGRPDPTDEGYFDAEGFARQLYTNGTIPLDVRMSFVRSYLELRPGQIAQVIYDLMRDGSITCSEAFKLFKSSLDRLKDVVGADSTILNALSHMMSHSRDKSLSDDEAIELINLALKSDIGINNIIKMICYIKSLML